MPNYNKVTLMGHLTRDPEINFTPSSLAITKFGMAINRQRKDKDANKTIETCFVEVVAFGKVAETIGEYFNKGKPIFIEGRLQYSQWEAKDGQKRNALSVMVEGFQFVGGHNEQKKKAEPFPEDLDIPTDEIPF